MLKNGTLSYEWVKILVALQMNNSILLQRWWEIIRWRSKKLPPLVLIAIDIGS